MPNWCNNILNVSGPKEDIAKFKAAANGPIQTYNEFRAKDNSWPIHDDVRLKSLTQTLPEAGESDVFSFHALYPVPEDFRRFPYDCQRAKKVGEVVGEPRPYGGYNWEINHWGCKWGAAEASLWSHEDSFLQYGFDTAWSPPISFLEKVASDWPTLSFTLEYSEPGMAFEGEAYFEGGEMMYDDTRPMEESEEEYDE